MNNVVFVNIVNTGDNAIYVNGCHIHAGNMDNEECENLYGAALTLAGAINVELIEKEVNIPDVTAFTWEYIMELIANDDPCVNTIDFMTIESFEATYGADFCGTITI